MIITTVESPQTLACGQAIEIFYIILVITVSRNTLCKVVKFKQQIYFVKSKNSTRVSGISIAASSSNQLL